jgi:quercetin dioxygenase-like cupin family protein
MLSTLESTELHETPNATMRRYRAGALALWRTEMAASAAGPEHVVDVEQTVVVIAGRLAVTVNGVDYDLGAGDALGLPAGAVRRVCNACDEVVVALWSSLPGAHARVGDGDPVLIPWSA